MLATREAESPLDAVAAIRAINGFVARWESALIQGKIRIESIEHLSVALRLKQFLLGEAESRHESRSTLTLDILQRRHAELMLAREKTKDVRIIVADEPGQLEAPGNERVEEPEAEPVEVASPADPDTATDPRD